MSLNIRKFFGCLFYAFAKHLLALLLFSFLLPNSFTAYANDVIFLENFDNDLSFSNLATVSAQGSVAIYDPGYLSLSSSFGRKFPTLVLTKQLPDDMYGVEIRFKYPTNYNFGTGVVLSDHYPVNNIAMTLDDPIYYFWADTSGLQARYLTSADSMTEPIYYNIARYDWHKLQFERRSNANYYIFDDNQINISDTTRQPEYIWFGNPHYTNTNDNWSTINIDYVKIYSISDDTLPTWYMSQRDPIWKDNEYDHANTWNPGGVNTIERYGCAMTSAAMILDKSGIREGDLSKVDPGELNAWLKGEPDGYLGNGLTNWIAIARRVKELAGDDATASKLEFARVEPTKEHVEEILGNGKSAIVNLGGHFVVIYDNKDLDNWMIADPYVPNHVILPKNTSLVSAGYYTPSETDLSHFLFTSSPSVNLQLLDMDGNGVPLLRTVESIKDEATDMAGPELAIYTFPQPVKGKYRLMITEGGAGTIKAYLYDRNGKVKIEALDEVNQEFEIDYDKEDISKTKITVPDVVKPSLTIITPELTNRRIIRGTASDNEGIQRVEVAIQTKKWWKIPYNFWLKTFGREVWSIFLPFFPDDQYRVRARAIDNAGNVSDIVEKYVTLDTTSPKVWGELIKLNQQKMIRLYANDNNGIEKIEYKWDKNSSNWSIYSSEITSTGRTLYYRAFDKAGNVSSVKSMYVR